MTKKKLTKKIVDKSQHVKNAIKTRKEVDGKLAATGYMDKADDFPLIGADKRINTKIDKPKIAKPKKKLTPEILNAIARTQGTKRKIYTKSEKEQDLETLEKFFGRRDDYTMIDPRELYGALQAVSPKFLKWLNDSLSGMEIDETKDIVIPKGKPHTLKVRKLEQDMYSGSMFEAGSEDLKHNFEKLTIPALATQIMSICEIYSEDEEELQNLYGEIKDVNESIKDLKQGKGGERKKVETKLNGIIDRLAEIEEVIRSSKVDEKVDIPDEPKANVDDPLVQDAYAALDEIGEQSTMSDGIRAKLKQLKDEIDKDVPDEDEPSPEPVAVKRIDENPPKCRFCGCAPCKCFIHLSKPTIKISPTGHIEITFSKDWNHLDRTGFMKSMGYWPMKKIDS